MNVFAFFSRQQINNLRSLSTIRLSTFHCHLLIGSQHRHHASIYIYRYIRCALVSDSCDRNNSIEWVRVWRRVKRYKTWKTKEKKLRKREAKKKTDRQTKFGNWLCMVWSENGKTLTKTMLPKTFLCRIAFWRYIYLKLFICCSSSSYISYISVYILYTSVQY